MGVEGRLGVAGDLGDAGVGQGIGALGGQHRQGGARDVGPGAGHAGH